MRILAINHELPPVDGGGANANYYIARELVGLGHRATVATCHFTGVALPERVERTHVIRSKWLRCRPSDTIQTEGVSPLVPGARATLTAWNR